MNYKTQMDAAKKGILTKEMKTVAQKEFMDETKLMELVASGRVAIPANIRHTSLSAEGIGEEGRGPEGPPLPAGPGIHL